jgi:S1-C subfamily serine protease
MRPKFSALIALVSFVFLPGLVAGQTATGTGFFITEVGHVVTNYHVVHQAQKIQVRTNTGAILSASLLRTDLANDLAILKVAGGSFPLPVARSSSVRLGERVFALGYPNTQMQGLSLKFTDGAVSSLAGIRDEPNSFQISVPVQPGNSGGPLFNSDGHVVGIIVAKLSAEASIKAGSGIPEAVNYAIKSNYLIEFVNTAPDVADKTVRPPKTKSSAGIPDLIARLESGVVMVIAERPAPIPPPTPAPRIQQPPPQSSSPNTISGNKGAEARCKYPAECGPGLTCSFFGSCVPY